MADGRQLSALKPYCPETVVLHSAFALVEREAAIPLADIDSRSSKDLVRILGHAYDEIDASHQKLGRHVHGWIFSELCRNGSQYFDEEADKFKEFPPLPRFSCAFYLELVKRLQWGDLMQEGLYNTAPNILGEIMDAITSAVLSSDSVDDPDPDTSLLFQLAATLLQTHADHCHPGQGTPTLHQTAASLIRTMPVLTRKTATRTSTQSDIIWGVTDLILCAAIQQAQESQAHCVAENLLQARIFLQDGTVLIEVQGSTESCRVDDGGFSKLSDGQRLSYPEDIPLLVDFIYGIIAFEQMRGLLQQDNSENTNGFELRTIGHFDAFSSWQPQHRCFIALSGALAFLKRNNSYDREEQVKLDRLYDVVLPYAQVFGSQHEKDWIHAMEIETLVNGWNVSILEEFEVPSEPLQVFLFKPDAPEDLFRYSVKRVCDRLTGYKECFDWLLTAEEFYTRVQWLECVQVHGPQLSGTEQLVKMTDILCLQWQLLSSGGSSDDEVYDAVRNVILAVYPRMDWPEQEKLLLYAHSKSCHLMQDTSTDSLFFNPLSLKQDRESFHQELVETFNKLVTSSERGRLAAGILKAALVMPVVLLSMMVEEAMKTGAHVKAMYQVHQTLSALCQFRVVSSGPSLLSSVIRDVAAGATSKQRENNLASLVLLLLQSTGERGLGVMPLEDFMEVVLLPHLYHHDDDTAIPTAFAVHLLTMAMATADMSKPIDAQLMKEHGLPIMLCLCELLDCCRRLWVGLAPSSLAEMEELKVLVLRALDTTVELLCELMQREPRVTKGVAWLYRRLAQYDWTVPLHVAPLFHRSAAVPPLVVPGCLATVCCLPDVRWTPQPSVDYDPDAVLMALFEACRVSDWMCQTFAARVEKFDPVPTGRLASSLAQILPHCVWQEHRRIVSVCRRLIDSKIVYNEDSNAGDESVTSQLSALLLRTLDFLGGLSCRAWANHHVWTHVTKHYVTTLKELCEDAADEVTLTTLFGHVCHVMSIVPSHVTDQLFVLTLDVVARISSRTARWDVSVAARLRESTSHVTNAIHKAALLQRLNR